MLALRSLVAKRRQQARESETHTLSSRKKFWVNDVSNEPTPFFIGLDVLRKFGLVIDYHYSRVYSHILKRCLPCAMLPTGHLPSEMMPSNSEQGQRPVSSQAFSTRHWGLHSRAREKGTLSFESSIFHFRGESEHEHGHTSTSEDDLLKLLNLPGHTQTCTRFDKRARTYRTTSSSGPLWENVVARVTIDDKTGHIMSLEYTKTHDRERFATKFVLGS